MNRLERLLRPRSVAIIGGGAFGTAVTRQCIKMGFGGDIWPVHPTKETVEGLKSYKTVAELPGAPDAAFVAVNRNLTIDMIRQLREKGAGGATCFAAGFRETGHYDPDGERLQAELLEAAGTMPIIGPNCYGLINYADGALLWPDQHGGRRLQPGEKGAAIITQSSNIACNLTMQTRGLPLAFLMTAGNQAQTGISEMGLGLIEDERVTSLGLHIEGFDQVAGFERLAARARELGKPIVAMKVGKSEQARAATVSHTASLAGSDAASDAFLKRLGIARVNTITSFLETLKLLHAVGPLKGDTLSSMSCSGGEASVMADSVEGRAVRYPALAEAHRAKVSETLGPLVAVANPLDYNTYIWAKEDQLTATFTAFVAGGFDLNLLVLDFPRLDRCSDADWWFTVNAFDKALKASGAKGAIVASMGENLPEAHCDELLRRGIVPIHGIAEAVDAAEAAAFIGRAWKRKRPPSGLPVPAGRRAVNATEAVAAAEQLGYPVAVKALGVAHKSEAGAVRLNLRAAGAVRAAADAMAGLGTGLYVERMVTGGVAELIVGFTRDPLFGPVMTLGAGGLLVELLRDSATLLLPASRDEIEDALRGLKLFPLLDGFRGRPKADLGVAIEAIESLAGFALAHADRLEELDVNPLIVCAAGQGAWVADALLVLTSPLAGEVVAKRPVGVVSGGTARASRTAEATPPGQTSSGQPPRRGEGKTGASS